MKAFKITFIAVFILSVQGYSQYHLGPNSSSYPGIPKGRIESFKIESKIYLNTLREVSVYIPAQYDPSNPAALMVFQDGHAYLKEDGDFRAPIVLDNLIAQKKMPVTIGLFINPGHDQGLPPPESPWRASNRSVEYDTMDDTYAQFILNEVIPYVQKSYTISDDPKMRAICGLSSGGICAFTVAWTHPEKFHKVMSHIGSFTDIRGGHNYPSLIRKEAKREIKVFLQDGNNDLNNQFGDWWLANLQMKSALDYKGYEYEFVAGNGGHDGKHAGAIFPQSLEWLWSDMVEDLVSSKIYSPADGRLMLQGPTYHYNNLRLELLEFSGIKEFGSRDKEQMFIIQRGRVTVNLNGTKEELVPNSIVAVMPGDQVSIESQDQTSFIFHLEYLSRGNERNSEEKSFWVDFENVEFNEHDRGGIRNYFRRSTLMCDYYEMHITNLNPGIKSHEPHTHTAAEIVIMIDGETEMEIGNEIYQGKKGDVYFLGANVPHAIRNTGKEQCMYFAYQWTTL